MLNQRMRSVSLCCLLIAVGFLFVSADSVQTTNELNVEADMVGELDASSDPSLRENSRIAPASRTIDLQSIFDKISSYINSSINNNGITSPYYGISRGVTFVIVFLVVIYILIIVSGTVVTTGRSLGNYFGVDSDEMNQLTHTITKAIDLMADKLTKVSSEDLINWSHQARTWTINGGGLPSWTASFTQADSVSAYISEHFYNTLIWLSKPFAGQIMVMGGLIVYMVVIVIITMTSGVFPISTSTGRQTREYHESNSSGLVELAETVMEAIASWDAREVKNSKNFQE